MSMTSLDCCKETNMAVIPLDFAMTDAFHCAVVSWFRTNGRVFPWRQTQDPFQILVAEMLLRLTGARKIGLVFNEIMQKYGTPNRMALADDEDLRILFQPLGLFERGEWLVDAAKHIVSSHRGEVPDSYEALTKIKGVGRYTANAVLSLAFDRRVPLVDGSVTRILSRCFNLSSSSDVTLEKLAWSYAGELLPIKCCREYNLGLLDIGALHCKSNTPKCIGCPIYSFCAFGKEEG